MSQKPVHILIAASFAPQLAERLTVPHRITPLHGQSDAEVTEILADTDVLVSGSYKAEWQRADTRRPLLVQSVGAGVDGIALAQLPRGSTVCNVYGHEHAVAERTFLHLLALQQGLLKLDGALRQGSWSPERPFLTELRGKNLLVLGLGHIGRELVRWGKFMGMHVAVVTRNAAPDRAQGLELAAFASLNAWEPQLSWADFIVVAIPSAPGTVGLIGSSQILAMKRTAFIVNVGRGSVIDEKALYTALRDRQIAGAGLDVWYRYPSSAGETCLPANEPFHTLDNVVMTPHKATVETMQFRWGEIAQNIARHHEGRPLENVVWRHPVAVARE